VTRNSLEKHQVFVYLAVIAAGLALGSALPSTASRLDVILWPALALLLYSTFTQVPLVHLREAFLDLRFLAAAVVGNFLLLPLVAWGLSAIAPDDPALRLGILLVLLVPCTDWFITFSQLGGGDARRAIAFAPVSLLLQLLLLPLYIWLFSGPDIVVTLASRDVLIAFGGLIVVPLLAAYVTEAWARRRPSRANVIAGLGWFPVPLLALVVFVIAASQVQTVIGHGSTLLVLVPIFALFLVAAVGTAVVLGRLFALPTAHGRTLAFSFGTRNSFVVLPLAIALPSSYELTVLVIVVQSLVELLGMMILLWWVPRRLFPCPSSRG